MTQRNSKKYWWPSEFFSFFDIFFFFSYIFKCCSRDTHVSVSTLLRKYFGSFKRCDVCMVFSLFFRFLLHSTYTCFFSITNINRVFIKKVLRYTSPTEIDEFLEVGSGFMLVFEQNERIFNQTVEFETIFQCFLMIKFLMKIRIRNTFDIPWEISKFMDLCENQIKSCCFCISFEKLKFCR